MWKKGKTYTCINSKSPGYKVGKQYTCYVDDKKQLYLLAEDGYKDYVTNLLSGFREFKEE